MAGSMTFGSSVGEQRKLLVETGKAGFVLPGEQASPQIGPRPVEAMNESDRQ